MRVLIRGAGVAGLTVVAHELAIAGIDVTVAEIAAKPGGPRLLVCRRHAGTLVRARKRAGNSGDAGVPIGRLVGRGTARPCRPQGHIGRCATARYGGT